MKRNATQKDIAEICDVSAACVGYILSGSTKYKFKSDTVERVKKVADQLHYRPNLQATNLRKNENKLVICIVGNCCRYSDTLHIRMLEEEVGRYGYHLLVHFLIGLSDQTKLDFIGKIINLPAGLIIWSLGIQDSMVKKKINQLFKKAPPSIHMSHALPDTKVDYMKILWDGSSIPSVVQFLKDRVCKRIAICPVSKIHNSGMVRIFSEAGAANNLVTDVFYPESHENIDCFEIGRHVARKIINAQTQPDGIYCISDETAFTLIETLREHGISVPEDICIISGGDSEFLRNLAKPLPYLLHDIPKLVNTAVKDLLERIERGDRTPGTGRCVGVIEQKLYLSEHRIIDIINN